MAKSWVVTGKRAASRKESISYGTLDSNGYLRFELSKNKERKVMKIHRIVAEHFLPKKEGCNIVNHKDGNKSNNDVSNLEWCTSKENNEHAYINGLKKTKITEKDVLDIRDLYKKGDVSMRSLASEFGVSYRNIHCIINRTTWKHI